MMNKHQKKSINMSFGKKPTNGVHNPNISTISSASLGQPHCQTFDGRSLKHIESDPQQLQYSDRAHSQLDSLETYFKELREQVYELQKFMKEQVFVNCRVAELEMNQRKILQRLDSLDQKPKQVDVGEFDLAQTNEQLNTSHSGGGTEAQGKKSMDAPRIKESILKKQVDLTQLQLTANFTSNTSLVSTAKQAKVITRIPLGNFTNEGLGPSASFSERPLTKVSAYTYSNTSVNTVRKSSQSRQPMQNKSSSAHKVSLTGAKTQGQIPKGLQTVRSEFKTFCFTQNLNEHFKNLSTVGNNSNQTLNTKANTSKAADRYLVGQRKNIDKVSKSLERPTSFTNQMRTATDLGRATSGSSNSDADTHQAQKAPNSQLVPKVELTIQKLPQSTIKEDISDRTTVRPKKPQYNNVSSASSTNGSPKVKKVSQKTNYPRSQIPHYPGSAHKVSEDSEVKVKTMAQQVLQKNMKHLQKQHTFGMQSKPTTADMADFHLYKRAGFSNTQSFHKDEENLETSIITNEGINLNNKDRIENNYFKSQQIEGIQQANVATIIGNIPRGIKKEVFQMSEAYMQGLDKVQSEGVIEIIKGKTSNQCICASTQHQPEEDYSMNISPSVSYIHQEQVNPQQQFTIQFESGANTPNKNMMSQKILICGELCKNLPAPRQKEIIRELMKKEFGDNIEMYANRANFGVPFQRKYIVDAKWWRNWCDYTSFELVSPQQKRACSPAQHMFSLTQSLDNNHGFSNQLQLANFGRDEQPQTERVDESNFDNLLQEIQKFKKNYFTDNKKKVNYRYPSIILNKNLLRGKDSGCLKQSLIEHHDFEAVSADIWKHLHSWYGCDSVIERQLKYDPESGTCILELYPEYIEEESVIQ